MRKIDQPETEFVVVTLSITNKCDTVKIVITYLFDQLLTLL